MADRDNWWCKTCGEPIFSWKRHTCPPSWLCWFSGEHDDDCPEDGHTVYASSARTAAEKFAEWWDSQGDYTCIGGEVVQVTVRNPTTMEEETFLVRGEMNPVYTAGRKVDTDG